ncbi:MAG TPA: hypothetical protein EYG03_10205 [Planctomycetes bacterium]|nr:hypothetical protein [Fuerstiella sp.]HIK92338.1 hypothetical protein [Planctomycetota bacterium]
MSSQKIQFSDEQLWQAFRYVGAELSTGEAEAFEQQLLRDVSLCEAVAEATMLTSTVAASGRPRRMIVSSSTTLSHSAGPARQYRMVALTAALCGCLALVVVSSGFRDVSDGSVDVVAQSDSADAELLVAAWADIFAAQTDDESEYDEFVQQELAVPDWMLAAVTLADLGAVDHSDIPVNGLMPDDRELF